MIVAKLKKIDSLSDFLELDLPAKLWNIRFLDGGKTIEFYFDTDDDKQVDDSLKIIMEILKSYKMKVKFHKNKNDVEKELKGES